MVSLRFRMGEGFPPRIPLIHHRSWQDASCPLPLGQGYRIWASIEVRKASSHPARLILRRMDAVLGCERRVLSASLRRMARFSGPWSLRLRARSSSKTTSWTQCSWFSIPQSARVIASTRAGDHGLDSKKYRTIGGSSADPALQLDTCERFDSREVVLARESC